MGGIYMKRTGEETLTAVMKHKLFQSFLISLLISLNLQPFTTTVYFQELGQN
jgi:hypothetical protein